MKIKVSEMTGPTLDWAVEKARGMDMSGEVLWLFDGSKEGFAASTDWAQGGPIIDRELIAPEPLMDTNCSLVKWSCRNWKGNGADFFGPTFLIAAMRCFCASKLGDTVEIPKELT